MVGCEGWDVRTTSEPVRHDRVETYEWLLRALGAFLDHQPTFRISVAEVQNGFLVRLQHVLGEIEPEVLRFDRDTLVAQLDQLYERHKPIPHARHQGLWASFPSGHSDFFRALGRELDSAGARDILIDELEDGVVVTYATARDGNRSKQAISLTRPDIERILNAAFGRRTGE